MKKRDSGTHLITPHQLQVAHVKGEPSAQNSRNFLESPHAREYDFDIHGHPLIKV
jgi:hypothetical protein